MVKYGYTKNIDFGINRIKKTKGEWTDGKKSAEDEDYRRVCKVIERG